MSNPSSSTVKKDRATLGVGGKRQQSGVSQHRHRNRLGSNNAAHVHARMLHVVGKRIFYGEIRLARKGSSHTSTDALAKVHTLSWFLNNTRT